MTAKQEQRMMKREMERTVKAEETLLTDDLAKSAGMSIERFYLSSRYQGGYVRVIIIGNARISVTRRSVRRAEQDARAVINEFAEIAA